MDRTIFDHPDFAIALDDLSFDFTNFFVDQNRNVFFSADDLFTGFNLAVGTEGIGRAWPAECRLALLP
jgi:hypothetical protein